MITGLLSFLKVDLKKNKAATQVCILNPKFNWDQGFVKPRVYKVLWFSL